MDGLNAKQKQKKKALERGSPPPELHGKVRIRTPHLHINRRLHLVTAEENCLISIATIAFFVWKG